MAKPSGAPMRTSPLSSTSTPETSAWACRKALSICSAAARKRSPALVSRAPVVQPLEQPRAERRFERRDAAARRRVVEPEPPRRGDELPGARHREEDADIVPVHRPDLSTIPHSRCAKAAIAVQEILSA